MEPLVLWLHVAAAIFLIGPVTFTAAATPRHVRQGNVEAVRYLARSTRLLGILVVLVFLVGLWLVPVSGRGWNEFWLSASMTLFVVALGLLHGLVVPDQRRALARMQKGESATVHAGRIAGVTYAVAAVWLVILGLMFWRPGG